MSIISDVYSARKRTVNVILLYPIKSVNVQYLLNTIKSQYPHIRFNPKKNTMHNNILYKSFVLNVIAKNIAGIIKE